MSKKCNFFFLFLKLKNIKKTCISNKKNPPILFNCDITCKKINFYYKLKKNEVNFPNAITIIKFADQTQLQQKPKEQIRGSLVDRKLVYNNHSTLAEHHRKKCALTPHQCE